MRFSRPPPFPPFRSRPAGGIIPTMPLSFTANRRLAEFPEVRRKILVTGAGGRIGSAFARANAARHDLRLMVLDEGQAADPKLSGDLHGLGEVVVADLADLDAMRRVCDGVDTVLHLAGDPSADATWSSLLPANVVGTYHAFAAAKAAGCRRVVYASSIHAVSGYPPDVQVKPSDPVNPGDLYGVTKCFGEALARYMAEQEGLSAVCVRIGAFQPEEKQNDPDAIKLMDAFVSHRDLVQLLTKCVEAEDIQFAVVHGLSEGRFKRLDISSAREIFGYAPQDDFTANHPELAKLHLEQVVSHSRREGTQKPGIREEAGDEAVK